MSAFGLGEDDFFTDAPTPIWPDHVTSFGLFAQCGTQWRHGFSGPTGLDYSAVLARMNATVPKAQREQVFEDVRAMEEEALSAMHERSSAT